MSEITNKISLSLISSYASTWGTWEGVRELVQNWHDGLYETIEANSDTNIISKKVTIEQVKPERGSPIDKEYRATTKNSNGEIILLGVVKLDAMEGRLLLINKGVSLQKKILLLGYSKKSKNRHVIGHFGEGLKVGALALVRDGRIVSMETSKDKWRFDLLEDPDFEEKVLTVVVTDRDGSAYPPSLNELENEDTCTSVSLDNEEWQVLCRRFLFLRPAKDYIQSEIGNLLLDGEFKSQLYVKGVWVADLTDEGLFVGVDFTNLPLDRDRNAVPKPSEIDHQVSCMWINAVKQRPSLAKIFYELLSQNQSKDVKQALTYADDELARMMVQTFLEHHGENVIPVGQEATAYDMAAIKDRLLKEAVICNDVLLSLLHMSGKYRPLKELLAEHVDEVEVPGKVIKPIQHLSAEEWSVLNHANELVQMYDPKFSLNGVDVVEDLENKTCTKKNARIEIPTWFFSLENVHANIRFCSVDQVDKCLCREVKLAYSLCLLSEHKSVIGADEVNVLLNIVHPLALQSCNSARPFCEDLHNSESTCNCNADHAMCLERETAFRQQMSKQDEEHLKAVETLQEKLQQVQQIRKETEAALFQREVKLVNKEHEIERITQEVKNRYKKECESKLDDAQRKAVDWQREIKVLKDELAKCRLKNEGLVAVNERKSASLREELEFYVTECAKRTEELKKACEANAEKEKDDNVSEKWKAARELAVTISTDLKNYRSRMFCVICKTNRRSILLVPCGHYQLCDACATQQVNDQNPKCPTCRTRIERTKTVFE